jgi:hypothetical protein
MCSAPAAALRQLCVAKRLVTPPPMAGSVPGTLVTAVPEGIARVPVVASAQVVQTEAAQRAAPTQALLHAPQCVLDVRVSTSQPLPAMPSQLPKFAAQVMPQADDAHTGALFGPDAQALLQAPQLALETRVSTSQPLLGAPSQSAKLDAQEKPHWPSTQTASALPRLGQARPQRPQLAALVLRATSQPSPGSPLQSAKPALQAKPQAPALHVDDALARVGHAAPQPPQWSTERLVSVSQPSLAMPLQSPKEGLQVYSQPPLSQRAAAFARAVQTAPQPPQCRRSESVETQTPLHAVCAPGQETWQRPAAQRSPDAQITPQAPQFAGSSASVTQRPAQISCPDGHDVTHARFSQDCPVLHAVPQAPQFARSVMRFAQKRMPPLSHSDSGEAQPTVQAPLEHTSPVMQARPQAPQFARSVLRVTQLPAQSVCPVGHVVTHAPETQTCPETQTRPQAPQFAGSRPVDTHTAPQAVCPDGHETSQRPALHTCPDAHALPQAPQFARSVRVSTQARAGPSPHSVSTVAQRRVHAPMEHTSPGAQAVPHAPQLPLSVAVVTQRPSQTVCPAGHEVLHMPPTHA